MNFLIYIYCKGCLCVNNIQVLPSFVRCLNYCLFSVPAGPLGPVVRSTMYFLVYSVNPVSTGLTHCNVLVL